ncbi:MAG: bifunctional phosphoribosylaminoimidazolecarboxamide formyltransferase/IMP cyclohydrolase, partial [Planctomycetota bacterium]
MDVTPVRTALLSVSDKSGLVDFARRLVAAGVELLSTGGTRRALEEAGLAVTDVAEYTGYPEMMGGRVKTLHPRVHGGLLCRRDNDADMAAAAEHSIRPIDLVVVNLYPFMETVAKGNVPIEEAIEQIDIGGPSMIRSAAKNHQYVAVVTQPDDYDRVAESIEASGGTGLKLRHRLALTAFSATAGYDSAITAYLAGAYDPDVAAHTKALLDTSALIDGEAGREDGDDGLPDELAMDLSLKATLRYGENPHQTAALYARADAAADAVVNGEQLHGKELSYNNWLDLDAAWAAARSLPVPGVAVLKHNNPCGAATAATVG